MTVRTRLLIAAALIAFGLFGANPAHAGRGADVPIGAIVGVAERSALSVRIAATTRPGNLGEAAVVRSGAPVRVVLDCVRTYTAIGVILMVPILNEIGYASGVGSDGRRWYLYFNQGYAFEASTRPGGFVPFDTCGVGYQIGSGLAAAKVVGQRVTAWTLAG